MNKLEIIQRLLDERHITAKEAMALMEKEYVYYPYYVQPWTPHVPYWQVNSVPCGGIYTTDIMLTTN